MDWRYAAHLQLMSNVAGSQGSRRTAGSGSQADSGGSIPLTRSNVKIQASGIFRRWLLVNSLFERPVRAISVQLATGADALGVALAATGATCLL
jgi:hypothetical protein